MSDNLSISETDPRFPSGKWVGFFVYQGNPQKYPTELELRFVSGRMTGTGSDVFGNFDVDGQYELADGKCEWIKQYLSKNAVDYKGFNEGKGIWGTWTINDAGLIARGGFQIWPVGMGNPSDSSLAAEEAIPYEDEVDIREFIEEPELVPMRGES